MHPLRSLGGAVYLPLLLFAIGQGSVIPVLALVALEDGASPAAAGLLASLPWVATMLWDLPSSAVIARHGERQAMGLATVVMIVAIAGCLWRPNLAIYGASLALLGSAWSIWLLARLTYLSGAVPASLRGRAMSGLGGVNRLGIFIGPFLGAALMLVVGLNGALYIHAATGLAAWFVMSRARHAPGEGHGVTPLHGSAGFRALLSDHKRIFVTAGVGALVMSALRGARQVLIPLWGAQMGLNAGQIAIVFGLSAAVDLLVVYPTGSIMDHQGRRSVLVAGLGTLSCGVLVLPLANTTELFVGASLFLGFGNGLTSGILMAVGADLAPPGSAARFLGLWRLIADIGAAAGPVFIGLMGSVASLAAGALAIGAIGLAATALVLWTVRETRHVGWAGRAHPSRADGSP